MDKPSWQKGKFAEEDSDPLSGFANIMDVMLVFALGLMLALVSRFENLQTHFKVSSEQASPVSVGEELLDVPDTLKNRNTAAKGSMESLGQVYRDPKSGKLILIQE
ncbi:DUF2149 domain-containing protein [Alteromonas sp. C1M14]|uniref:DUF2149 domain-containing protein n=1 Tax=Alteromonas sp. C1M14 TaxID=2841567 RepID=UPI001C09D4E4|nr:DUF2149 domain-containing protein [Alteromonas sp. C1M14]MBU2979819.1 DUF2149 domain-containing protein [Alteromonas sp. C1M14]